MVWPYGNSLRCNINLSLDSFLFLVNRFPLKYWNTFKDIFLPFSFHSLIFSFHSINLFVQWSVQAGAHDQFLNNFSCQNITEENTCIWVLSGGDDKQKVAGINKQLLFAFPPFRSENNYETYFRRARVQVWTISKYFLTISNNFLSLSPSILLYLGLSRSILDYLGLYWCILVHLCAAPPV